MTGLFTAIFAGLILICSSAASAGAGTYQDAEAAVRRGDHVTALRLYRSLAEQGDTGAQAKLAGMYYRGEGVPQNYAEAAKWYRLLAERGNIGAQGLLGLMYEDGEGVPQNYAEAAKWYRLAAEHGNAGAEDLLGHIYDEGKGVPRNYAEAAKWYHLAAEQGNADAQTRYGSLCYTGRGVPQSYAETVKWYRLAAEQGDAKGQILLGLMYEEGHGVRQDPTEAAKWYRFAAEQGDANGQAMLAELSYKGKEYAEAAKWYRLAAEQGDADARAKLAGMYLRGEGVPRNYAEAAKWYRLAAEQGNTNAQGLLGSMYVAGQGVPQNYAEAIKWLHLPAEKGGVNAQAILAELYYKGKDYTQALKWYHLAAEQGNAGAQHNLGALYYSGKGVPQNYIAAYMWFSLAAAQGDQDAPRIRNEIAGMMTPAELAEAQKQAAAWRPKKINAALAETTPRSHSSEKPHSAATSGTAFFISQNGETLTNAHVVEGCQQIRVNGGTARLLARDGTNDLALLATDQHPAKWASWRLSVRQGEDIVVYGFPLTGVLSSGGNVVTGNVTALAGLEDDSRFLQISAPVQPGNSGGPLFDRFGNVVGVVVSKLNAIRIASATGDIPQNVNFAIKASVATAFLDAQRVTISTAPPPPPGYTLDALSTPDIAARAQVLAVQVVCTK